MDFPVQQIEAKIGYVFKDKRLLTEAFTHSSYANVYGEKSNERLEYLGDAVLQLIVTDWQYTLLSTASEGVMTKERQRLVCKNALESAVDALGIEGYLRVYGKRDNIGEKTTSSLFESVVGAIYLDGGYESAKEFVLKRGNLSIGKRDENHKGALQEFLQGIGEPPPVYKTVKTGPDHAPTFRAEAFAMGEVAKGEGKTKKEAESVSAQRLLWELSKGKIKARIGTKNKE